MQARRTIEHGPDGGWSSVAVHLQPATGGKEGFYLTLFPDARPPTVVFLRPPQLYAARRARRAGEHHRPADLGLRGQDPDGAAVAEPLALSAAARAARRLRVVDSRADPRPGRSAAAAGARRSTRSQCPPAAPLEPVSRLPWFRWGRRPRRQRLRAPLTPRNCATCKCEHPGATAIRALGVKSPALS